MGRCLLASVRAEDGWMRASEDGGRGWMRRRAIEDGRPDGRPQHRQRAARHPSTARTQVARHAHTAEAERECAALLALLSTLLAAAQRLQPTYLESNQPKVVFVSDPHIRQCGDPHYPKSVWVAVPVACPARCPTLPNGRSPLYSIHDNKRIIIIMSLGRHARASINCWVRGRRPWRPRQLRVLRA